MLFLTGPALVFAQFTTINWSEISSNFTLPANVRLFKGERLNPSPLKIFYFSVDLNDNRLAVRPYLTTSPAPLTTLTTRCGAVAAVNGGFFSGTAAVSAVVYPGEVKAQNIAVVTRNSQPYPVVRSFFSLDTTFQPAVSWIYHFGNTIESIYGYPAPLAYIYNDPTPKSAPSQTGGTPLTDLLTGIGGAPTLLKNGQPHITYNEELMWGSGVGLSNNDPRTAVGYTADRQVILLVADGRQAGFSDGVSLPELAEIMDSLGCVEAMNLDGGGSTQMTVGNQYVNSPSEMRSIPSLLAIVPRDSVRLPASQSHSVILDTGDPTCQLLGSGWFASANAGYYGTTPAMLNTIGNGDKQAIFNTSLERSTLCQVYVWWVAASNRCKNTPIVVVHTSGRDTIRVDQTQHHAQWVSVGTYLFGNDPEHKVIISNAGTIGTYIVADAIKLTSSETIQITSIKKSDKPDQIEPELLVLAQNYPNPFNHTTRIEFQLRQASVVSLQVFDIHGYRVSTPIHNRLYSAGRHAAFIDGNDLTSGVYFYRLEAGRSTSLRKMIHLK